MHICNARDDIKITFIVEGNFRMFETKSAKQTLEEFEVNSETGLTNEEASRRQIQYGFNKLEEKKKKPLILVFLSQFNDPMIFILLAAAVLSIGISLYQLLSPNFPAEQKPDVLEIVSDPVIILAVCFLNAIIGTVQENKAEKSLEALKKMSSPTCFVRREGKVVEIKAEELVPGDIVILEEGRIVPADIRLISEMNLKTDESSLTGESLPVEKNADFVFTEEVGVGDRINMVYMSTPVVYGHGEGVVVKTGMNTETGKIAKLLADEDSDQTPLQKKLAELSKFLGILTIIIVVVLFGIQMLQLFVINKPNDSSAIAGSIVNDFMFAISLAVAAVPEGLPAVVTIVLALGVQRMVKANTIVRKLPSVETLGAVSVVCSDKTGTLTQNKMTVVRAYTNGKFYAEEDLDNIDLHWLSMGMSLCSNAAVDEGMFGDPTEIALVVFANRHGLNKKYLDTNYPRIDEYPFDSVRKMMSVKNKYKEGEMVFTKGAIDQILKRTTKIWENGKIRAITEDDKKTIMEAADSMSKDALRVLGLAYKYSNDLTEEDLVFSGIVGMIDPARPEAVPAVEIFKKAGITTIMITGDHRVTALAIARDLGIAQDESQVMSGDEIDQLSLEELQEKVKVVRVFARVSPENKVNIVKAIRANGNIAAMTGDGVNDAPSLKQADIGIAMGITGTDVAKGAADMVLTDDNFASIEKAVEEGRGIYANIKKTVLFLLGSNIAEVLTMFVVVILSLFSSFSGLSEVTPLLSVHILFVNLVTDSLPAVALGADEKEKDVMKQQPRDSKESLFARGGVPLMLGYGALITIGTLVAFFVGPLISMYLLNIPQNVGSFTFETYMGYFTGDIPYLDYDEKFFIGVAQTCAFCVLSLSELFHMLGMTSIRKSFVHNFKTKNKLLWLSFALGIALQVGVVEIPYINAFFKCGSVDIYHWLMILGLSILPLIAHEIVALVLYLKDKNHKSK